MTSEAGRPRRMGRSVVAVLAGFAVVVAEGRIRSPPQRRSVGIQEVFGVGEGMPQLVQRLAQIVARLSFG